MKNLSSHFCLASVAFFAFVTGTTGIGAERARWDAASPRKAGGFRLDRAEDSVWSVEKVGGKAVARLQPSQDYYSRAAYKIVNDGPELGPGWLVLEYLDRGYGLITVAPGVPQTQQTGVGRVNTGRTRRAVFRYQNQPAPRAFRVEGLNFLQTVTWTDHEPALEPTPLVEPALCLNKYSERVTTVPGDALRPENAAEARAGWRNQLPLIRAMGFNGVESYVRWGWVERERGVYDWSYYDAMVAEIERHGLQWFPMLLAGSGYALPAWLYESTNNIGFKCLEHGITHDTQTIFHPFQAEYAQRFISEFGKHYGQRKALLGIRLGPSGDFGEAQYPAKGPGYNFRESHTHIGYWAGDDHAQAAFRDFLRSKYTVIDQLNTAWGSEYGSFDQVKTFLPVTAVTRRKRLDFADWYMGAMSRWCEQWAVWSRAALPHTVIHQSSGGWGPVEIGTDYSYQARSMAKVHGGMRLTNEGDDYPDNFTITRMAASAARFYGIPVGYEPGGFGSKRGVIARLFNTVTTDGVHLFYYLGNLTANDQALDAWLRSAKYLDQRAPPLIDVAAFYPDTALKLDDEVLRYRWASTFFTVGRTLREQVDFDYASEQMILDGALERYKVLLFLWGAVTEKPVLERIDQWVRGGGTLVYSPRPRGHPVTVEQDDSISRKWLAGDTGRGRVIQWHGDLVPARSYAGMVRELLLKDTGIHPRIRAALKMEKPECVFWSVLQNGKLALLNFGDQPAKVRLAHGRTVSIAPYEMTLE